MSWIPCVSDLTECVNEGALVEGLKRSVRVGCGAGQRGAQALLIPRGSIPCELYFHVSPT